ncbi:SpaH/EbpB family LPXTG-anchored major pilin [Butyrivibrio sp. NC2007]|uniref:SpaH/EbpB family LPXTG-anchored major pilin n=1 Tax=Butyrivibrio sp. NC2007 TaxID=1280683 RepID=UPI0003B73EB1|nr:SpaH/EbpB family LPXTG-anchored major pilin [Butyrivibrio sp. NC2007]
MKGIKKLLTGILAATMVMGMSVTAFAGENTSIVDGAGTEQSANTQNGTAAKGSITVNKAVKGEKYKLYKIFDFEAAGISGESGVYTIDSTSKWYGFVSSQTKYLELTKVTGSETKYYVKWSNTDTSDSTTGNDKTAIAAFAKAAQAYAVKEGSPVSADAETTADEEGASFSELDYGYYMVSSSVGALVGIDTVNSSVTINEKNEIPTSEKKVEEDSARSFGDKNDANIGQVVNYKSTVTIPAGGSTNVVFHDAMTSGLTFDSKSVVVKNGETTLGSEQYTLETSNIGTDTFQVVFKNSYTETLTEATTITITYSATLNSNAVVYDKESSNKYGGGNDNHSKITYGNAGETEWDWTRTYTYPVDIIKVDESDKPLEGAEFTLSLTSSANSLISLVQISAGNDKDAATYRVATSADEKSTTKLVTPKSGKLYISGLDADTYSLTETKAPEGFNLLAEPVTFVIDSNTDSAQGDNNTSQTKIEVSKTSKGATFTELSVVNKTGTLLPSTGGIGTTIFYIVGGLLIVAGVAYFIVRRKADAE